jgi:hypothetical protein
VTSRDFLFNIFNGEKGYLKFTAEKNMKEWADCFRVRLKPYTSPRMNISSTSRITFTPIPYEA